MKIKYFLEDGSERIVDVEQRENGTIILPRDLVIPCGCNHNSTETKQNLWPAAFFFVSCLAAVTVAVWKILDVIG